MPPRGIFSITPAALPPDFGFTRMVIVGPPRDFVWLSLDVTWKMLLMLLSLGADLGLSAGWPWPTFGEGSAVGPSTAASAALAGASSTMTGLSAKSPGSSMAGATLVTWISSRGSFTASPSPCPPSPTAYWSRAVLPAPS